MTYDDLIALITSVLGITRDQLLYALVTIAGLAPAVSWLRPRVDPVLLRWGDAAALTRTTADDIGVRVLAALWGFVVWLPAWLLSKIPVFATADEVEDMRDRRRVARALEVRR